MGRLHSGKRRKEKERLQVRSDRRLAQGKAAGKLTEELAERKRGILCDHFREHIWLFLVCYELEGNG